MTAAYETPGVPHELAAEVAAHVGAVQALIAGESPTEPAEPACTPALDHLVHSTGLSPFERHLIGLLLAFEISTPLRVALHDAGLPGISLGLAAATHHRPHFDALAPHRPLHGLGLVTTSGAGALTDRLLRLHPDVLYLALGHPVTTPTGWHVLGPRPVDELPPNHRSAAHRIASTLEATGVDQVHLTAGIPTQAVDVARAAAALCGRPLFSLVVDGHDADPYAQARAIRRHSSLGAVIALVQALPGAESAATALVRALPGPTIAIGALSLRTERSGQLVVHLDRPSSDDRAALWTRHLGSQLPAGLPARLARHFDLQLDDVRAAAKSVGAYLPADADAVAWETALWEACQGRARQALDAVATRVHKRAVLDDLVVTRSTRAELEALLSQARRRDEVFEGWGLAAGTSSGTGLSALFAGESGTGKTLAASAIAAALNLDLYRIDLATVLDKYIGETQKKLDRVFAAAESGGAALLFDEADALFGQRTEVRNSHDRFANTDVSYLLQRLDSFEGLAILTTNLPRAIDTAFVRRLRFVVRFDFPGLAERRELWARILPASVPTDGLDLDLLAQLGLTGGEIRNVAVAAAFLAAETSSPVTMGEVRRAAERACARQGRSLSAKELKGWP